MQRQRLPGVSVAVVKEGKVVKAEGYGLGNAELKIRATPETVYQIGSVSKQLIAAGIMLLVQDGKLSLDDKVSKYLAGTPETWQAITVHHLLTHTSGILNEPPGFDPFKTQNDADVVRTAYSAPLLFSPGEKWQYSNTGYFALADIIRAVSGEPWGAFLHKRLFQPLDMNSTRTTTAIEIVPNRADGYGWRDGTLHNAGVLLALRPSGAFLSTVLDLAKWDAALYSDRLFSAARRDQMWTPVTLNSGASYAYGFGWQIDDVTGHKRVHHSGTMPGFRATIQRYVDDKLTIIVLVNTDNADPGSIARGIAATYIPGLIPQSTIAAPTRTAVTIDPKLLDAYVGQYQPNPSVTVTISREGDKLMFESSGSPGKLELLPESENSFFTNALPFTFSFVKDETGKVTHLVLQNAGREAGRAQKIK
jgi:CubicO group peptidase (beta-lactamase class C family)